MTVVETKATLKVVRTGVKRVLIYSMPENATFCSLPWSQVDGMQFFGATRGVRGDAWCNG